MSSSRFWHDAGRDGALFESVFTAGPTDSIQELSFGDGIVPNKPQSPGSCEGDDAGETQASMLSEAFKGRAGAILIVEDEEMLLLAVSKMLRKTGYSVLEAADGNTAVDLLRRYKDNVALIVLDVNLPGLSSREILEEAQRLKSRILVILTSAFSQNDVESSFVGLRVDHFMRKPYRLATLVKLLHNFLPAP
jgi:CheY-like chemotaxis protein